MHHRKFAARIVSLPLLLALAAGAGLAYGQGADFGGGAPKKAKAADGDLDAQEGLESATPTDNVNEISGNGSSGPAPAGGAGGDANFPAANDAPAGLDLGNDGGTGGGNGVFDDAPANAKGNKANVNAVSAFGNDAPPGNAKAAGKDPKAAKGAGNAAPANAAAPGGNAATPTLNATPNVTPNAAPAPAPNAAPANNAKPADAEALLNQVNSGGNTPAPAAAPNATPATPNNNNNNNANGNSADATGQEELAPKAEGPPPIDAPPLPPPNEFAGAPPVPGTMRLMAEGEAPEEYLVQPGDTLFDICDQLLDEAGYWPKLWALNPEIKNPHFIFPNMKLRFYPGDDENPPYLQVVTEDDVIPIDKGDLDEQELIAEKVNFPQEEALREASQTEVVGPEGVDALEDAILTAGRRYEGGDIQVQVPGFIYAQEKEPLGYVIGGRSGEISVPPDGQALIEGAGGLTAGTLYTIIRPGEEIEDPDTGDRIGYKYYFIANVKIDRGIGQEAFIGTVQDNRLQVLPNDIIVNYVSTKRTVPGGNSVGSLSSTDAYVVGFEYFHQELGGQGHYAFIDKGNGDGIAPGMYLPIYSTPGYLTSSFGSSDLPIDYEYIGVMRIIDVTDAGAVGYVVRNVKEIRMGDRTSKGSG